MRNKKRFAALALAAVLAFSQVSAVAPASAVVAEETEVATESYTEAGTEAETADGTEANSGAEADSQNEADAEAGTDAEADAVTEDETEEGSGSDASGTNADGTVAGVTSDGSAADDTEVEETEESAGTEETGEEAETEESAETEDTVESAETEESAEDAQTEESTEADAAEEAETETADAYDYWIDWSYPENTSEMLLGGRMEIVFRIYYNYYCAATDEWSYDNEVVDFDLTYTGVDEDVVSLSQSAEEDGIHLYIDGTGAGDTSFKVKYATSDGAWSDSEWIGIQVREDGYYYLSVENYDIEVPLGESITVDEMADAAGLTLFHVSEDGETEAVEIAELVISYVDEEYQDGYWSSIDEAGLGVRLNNDWSWISVTAYDEEGNELASTGLNFPSADYNVELSLTDENLNEYGVYIVYGYEQTVALTQSEDDAYGLPDGYYVTWDIEDESGLLASVGSDDTSLTLEVTEEDLDYDGWWANVHATVYYEGNEICSADRDFEIVIPYAEYYTWEDTTRALGEGDGYEAKIDCYVRSYEYPWGENTSVEVTDLSVVSQYEYTDDGEQLTDDVISLEGDAESGWSIGTNTYGYAIMRAAYTDLDGEEQTFEFTIYVEGEYYSLEAARPTDTDMIAVGEDKETVLKLVHVYTDDENNADSEEADLSNYTVCVEIEDENILSYELTEGGSIVFTGLNEGGTRAWITVLDEEGNEAASTDLWWNVTADYWDITGTLENVGLGESPDWSVLSLVHTYVDENGDQQTDSYLLDEYAADGVNAEFEIDGTRYRIYIGDYDENAWAVEEGTEDELVPTLVRTGTWWTDVWAVAQYYDENDEEWYDLIGNWFSVDELVYETSFSNDSADGGWVIYAGIDMTVSYGLSDDSDTIPDDAEYIWAVQYWDDDEQEMLDVYEDLATWAENEDGTITITTYSDEREIRVSLQVMYGDNEIIWAEEWISTRTEGSYINIWVEDGSLLYGESTYVYGTYEDDSNELTFSDVKVVSYDSWDDYDSGIESENTCATVSQDEEGNWVITANTDGYYGVVQVVVTYYDSYEETVGSAEAGTIWVGGDEIVFEYPEGQDFEINRPEEDNTIEIPVEVYHVYAEQNEDGEWETKTEEVEICGLVYYNEYDNSVIDASYSYEGNSLVFTVTGLEEGWTNFSFSIVDEYSDEQGYEWISISVNGKLDASIDTEEYTVEKEYGDGEFNLVEELDMEIVSDSDVYYTILEGEDVVEIDEDGTITIIGVGTAIIKVYVEETNTYSYAKVNITVDVDRADAVITGTDSYEVTYGTTAEFYLDDITNTGDGTLSYEVTSGTAVVSVDESGLVKVLAAGTAEITVSAPATELYNAASFTVAVVVNEAETETETETETESETENETESETENETESETENETESETEIETETETEIETETETETEIETETETEIETETETETESETEGATETESETETETAATESETTESEAEDLQIITTATDDEYTIGKDTSAVVKCSGELSEFVSAAVDGVTVDPSNYTLTEGSTIITFTQDYMDSLSVGVHTVTLTYTGDRTVSALLTVMELTGESESESETETTATESESETETAATESESETETTATESETETETTATESETETETTAAESETETTATESETTETESETTATETTATESETDSTVATGDGSPIEVYAGVMLLALSILMAGALYRRMNRNAR